MVKAAAMKKRYILFEYSGSSVTEPDLKKFLYSEALKFFGEYGLSFAGLKLMEYDEKKKIGIIRCERSHLDQSLGFLALATIARGRVVSKKSSGTIASLKSA